MVDDALFIFESHNNILSSRPCGFGFGNGQHEGRGKEAQVGIRIVIATSRYKNLCRKAW